MRLFVAVDLSGEARAEAVRVADHLRDRAPRARFAAPENLHVTIAFLGSMPAAQPIEAALAPVAAGTAAPALSLEGIGGFPSLRRARVLWVGLRGGEALGGVAAGVAAALVPLGYRPESRPFSAHVTLARLARPEPVDPSGIDVAPVAFAPPGLALYRSHLGRPAARHERLALVPFGG